MSEREYILKWKGEVIEESIKGLAEARFLQGEYNLAYRGGVSIVKQ